MADMEKEVHGMNNINGYGFYQNAGMVGENIRKFGRRPEGPDKGPVKNGEDPAAMYVKDKKTEGVGGIQNGVELSEGAKKILEELKEKYGDNTDFFVANYSSDEEAQEYLSRGTKDYSVLIEPELLEEMARDAETKEKYMGIIEDGTKQLDSIKDQLKEAGKDGEVKNIGFSVSKDGTISFFAQLEQSSKEQNERIAELREKRAEKNKEDEEKLRKKREEKKAAEKPDRPDFNKMNREQVKRADIKADSAEELLDKIINFDWNSVKSEQMMAVGSKVDFTA
ncbi:MAG: hypothetical protein IJP84_05900 [Lachnospiraceae bacterium]|nr:hypothetical protein [Lachnospiraceae bacterium]